MGASPESSQGTLLRSGCPGFPVITYTAAQSGPRPVPPIVAILVGPAAIAGKEETRTRQSASTICLGARPYLTPEPAAVTPDTPAALSVPLADGTPQGALSQRLATIGKVSKAMLARTPTRGTTVLAACMTATICLSSAAASAQQADSLAIKYGPQVLQGSSENIRLNAVEAPLPLYPPSTRTSGRQGLVVIEFAISPAGQVVDGRILESFDARASAAVLDALKRWRFYSIAGLEARGIRLPCSSCYRVNRLAFDFRIDHQGAHVTDLTAAELARANMRQKREGARNK